MCFLLCSPNDMRQSPPPSVPRGHAHARDIYLPWMVGPFFFFSAPSSKCLQRPKFFILRLEHFSHFILRVIFLVTCSSNQVDQSRLLSDEHSVFTTLPQRFMFVHYCSHPH